jgi:hypothetical protein
MRNVLVQHNVLQLVVLRFVRLEFVKVVVLLLLLQFRTVLENDEPASPIPQRQILARVIELKRSDVVLLDKFLALALVPK